METWKAELADAQVEISALDASYARLRLSQIDVAAQHAISTLPPEHRRPFLQIIQIAQDARRGLLGE